MALDTSLLLIARKNGSSSTRRQYGFATQTAVDRAIIRWRAQGFNTWCLFGPRPTPDAQRPLIRDWQDATADHTVPPRVEDDDASREPIHTATGEPTNAARAARVEDAMRAYTKANYGKSGEEDATIAQDFITDVLHWVVQRMAGRYSPRDVAEHAIDMFEEEHAQEQGVNA